MATNAIFRNLANLSPWRNKYLRNRGVFDIKDANLHHGDIRPFACPEVVCESVPNYKSLYWLPSCPCLGFEDGRKVIRGFCDDQYFHIENGILRQSTAEMLCRGESCCAGSPFSTTAPGASAGCSGCDGVTVSYVITYVTRLPGGPQVEGAPSPPSPPVVCSGATPNAWVSWSDAPDAKDFCIVATRLYRTEADFAAATGGTANPDTEWVLVAEFEGGKGRRYKDTFESSETKYPLMTYAPMPFPAPDQLVDLARTDDGIVVVDAHRVYLSLNGEPMFTWDGVVEIEDEIGAVEATNNRVYVLTNNRPVLIAYGVDRNGEMTIERKVVPRNLPLTSKASVSNYHGALFFASTYSLYKWYTNQLTDDPNSLLKPLLTPEQWKSIDPYTVRGTQYEYGYIMFSDKLEYALMMEFNDDGVGTVQETHLMPITYIHPSAFGLDYEGNIVYSQDGELYRWDWRRDVCSDFEVWDHVRPNACEQCECCPWSVKFYYDNEGKNHFSHMRVEWDERSADHLDISFHIHEFGREIERSDTMEIISSRGFGIPYANVGYQSCYAHLRGCGIVHEVKVATSAQELSYGSTANVEGDGDGL